MTGRDHITKRARHRPKANLGLTMKNKIIAKLLAFAHLKSGKAIQGLITKLGVLLAGNGIITEGTTQEVIGVLFLVSGELLDWAVFQINRRFVKDLQVKEGIKPDAVPGPVTREVANVPHLNADGTPILKAKPTDKP